MITIATFAALAGLTAVLRAAVSAPLNRRWRLPIGTLVVNTTGSLALGLLVATAPPAATIIGAGGLGAYTTFSRFSVEVEELLRDGSVGAAATYIAASVIGSLAAAWLGLALAT